MIGSARRASLLAFIGRAKNIWLAVGTYYIKHVPESIRSRKVWMSRAGIAVFLLIVLSYGGLEMLGWTVVLIDAFWKFALGLLSAVWIIFLRFLSLVGLGKLAEFLQGGFILWLWSKMPRKVRRNRKVSRLMRRWRYFVKWKVLRPAVKGRVVAEKSAVHYGKKIAKKVKKIRNDEEA